MAETERQSNFELMRLLAMLAIVAGHLFTEGRVTAHAPPSAWLPCLLLGNGARIAVDLFVLAGCWFLVDEPRFRADRWLRLHATVLCYTLPLTALTAVVWGGVGAGTAVRAALPLLGRPLWFASAWLTLLPLAPALNAALAAAPRRCAAAAAALGLVLAVPATFGHCVGDYFADLLWFVFLHLSVGLFKRAPRARAALVRIPRGAALALGLTLYAAPVLVEWGVLLACGPSVRPPAAYRTAARLLADFKSAPAFLCALSVFAFFLRLDVGRVRWINRAARPAFAVYVAHQVPAFWPHLWTDVLRCPAWSGSALAPLAGAAAAVALYAALALVESARRRWLAPPLARRFERRLFGRFAPALRQQKSSPKSAPLPSRLRHNWRHRGGGVF